MVFSTKQMHTIAVAAAIEKGPCTLGIDGEQYAAYALTKKELYQLFVGHGYSADRTRWLSTIEAWGNPNLWNELVPNTLRDPNNWSCCVLFRNLDDDTLKGLQIYAENVGAKAWPKIGAEVVTI